MKTRLAAQAGPGERAAQLLAGVAMLMVAIAAQAQSYPVKPVRMIVPFPPGGAPDFVPRMLAERITPGFGQPMVIENRSGAAGMIAAENVAAAAPDGYTLLHTTSGTHVTPIFLAKNLRYDPVKDFTPISIDVEATLYLIANPGLPANTMSELIDYAKRNPGKLNYGSSGIGSLYHLSGELIRISAGLDLVHVPYKGSPQTVPDLIAGQIMLSFGGANILPHVKSGKIKILALLEDKRLPGWPGAPAITETVPGYRKLPTWFGVLGPAGMPAPVVTRLQNEFIRAVNAPELRARWDEGGFVIVGGTAEQFAATLKSDIEITGRIVKAANIRPE